jgi:hydrogenase expression/formation protein HypC
MCLAVPGQVLSILDAEIPELRCGQVDFGGIRKQINLAFTPEAKTGDYVLVHVGFALTVVDEIEAKRIFEDLKMLGELSELEQQT